jgi:hypothetical protein
MWARGAAIRPVPTFAVVPSHAFERVEAELSSDDIAGPHALHKDFLRFEQTQPVLAVYVGDVLARPLDETALALGYFLTLAIWLSFERTFEEKLGPVDEAMLASTRAALTLEEELRADHSEEPLDLDDVVALEQPHALAFMNEHLEAALETVTESEERDVDLDDVHLVFRTLVVMVLALSHAVRAEGRAAPGPELLA